MAIAISVFGDITLFIKNINKTKTPPNNKEVLFNFNQAALPYNEPAYKNIQRNFKEDNEDNLYNSEESGSEEVQQDLESFNNLRVSTRARRSYELDRYEKNAMLIIDNKTQLNSSYYHYKIKEAFEKYRFEVEMYENISRDEIIAVCERFFQRDFSDYGAVAVAVLADVIKPQWYQARNSGFTENDVLKYLTTNQPPSLQGKPKISIVEASDYTYDKRIPLQHPDILRFHIPVTCSIYTSHPDDPYLKFMRPIQVLCKDIVEKGCREDLYSLMVSSAMTAIRESVYLKMYPIKIESTLEKDVMLYPNDTS